MNLWYTHQYVYTRPITIYHNCLYLYIHLNYQIPKQYVTTLCENAHII